LVVCSSSDTLQGKLCTCVHQLSRPLLHCCMTQVFSDRKTLHLETAVHTERDIMHTYSPRALRSADINSLKQPAVTVATRLQPCDAICDFRATQSCRSCNHFIRQPPVSASQQTVAGRAFRLLSRTRSGTVCHRK